jgi:hypothetical protein
MKLTDEVKALLYAQYIKSEVIVKPWSSLFNPNLTMAPRVVKGQIKYISIAGKAIIETSMEGAKTFDIDQLALVLKPLSSITEQSIFMIARLFSLKTFEIKRDARCVVVGDKYFYVHICFRGEIMISKDLEVITKGNGYCFYSMTSQLLQSEGYDLPNYFLEKQTLYDSGLAVYE